MKQTYDCERSVAAARFTQRKGTLIALTLGVVAMFFVLVADAQIDNKRVAALVPILKLLLLDSDPDLPLPDRDNDGVPDRDDDFPDDPDETLDTDGDGIGDNADPNPNVVDSLVITAATDVGSGIYIEWISAYSDDCRVLYGPRGSRPAQAFSSTSEFLTNDVGASGSYKVLVECYSDDGSSTFSLPAIVEVP